jgi:NTE family protein
MREKRKIAIACQGGGSQTAFTAGALMALLEDGFLGSHELVTITGTSGGAICALLAWYAIRKGDDRPGDRLAAFWHDNSAQTANERLLNRGLVELHRMGSRGHVPTLSVSPASAGYAAMLAAVAHMTRPSFTDLRAMLATHVDFGELGRWGALADRPILLLGAANVLTGRLATFCSRVEAIRIEHVLASCAVPSIFAAVEIDEHAFWDGLFSDNPPVSEAVAAQHVGADNVPHEVWVIKINPTGARAAPVEAEAIADRRNQMIGNMSLFHQLDVLAWMNELMLRDAFRPEFLDRFELREPIRIPKCYPDDPDRPFHIPFIEMSPELQGRLDYESKLDRDSEHIAMLMADGAKQARAFLTERRAAG